MNIKKTTATYEIRVGSCYVKLLVDYTNETYNIYTESGNKDFVFVDQGKKPVEKTYEVLNAMAQAVTKGENLITKHKSKQPF